MAQDHFEGTARPRAVRIRRRPRVLMVTEGTWPYVLGGVSSWCQLLLDDLVEFDIDVLSLVAGDERRRALYPVPGHVRLLPAVELWSERISLQADTFAYRRRRTDLPAGLVDGLLRWDSDLDALQELLLWCRRHPRQIRPAFRSTAGWELYLEAMTRVLDDAGGPKGVSPPFDVLEAARLYQTLYWVARTAAEPTPPTDLVHITAAGWSAIPAATHRSVHRTPVLLSEHGLFVREAYLGAIQQRLGASLRFAATRLARGLTRLAYAVADVVSPVTESHAGWEQYLGARPDQVRPIPNGVNVGSDASPLPGTRTVVTVGRIDPLKDVATMLRVADVVTRRHPDVRFLHYGPVSPGQDAYADACRALHDRLELGRRFTFMGSTSDPHGALRAADVVIMTSISEGMPMAVLEAMAEARPVVATTVGGVADTLRGCGLLAPPGDVLRLGAHVMTLLENPDLAADLGRRGYDRLLRRYQKQACVGSYRELIAEMAAGGIAARLDAGRSSVRRGPATASAATPGGSSWAA